MKIFNVLISLTMMIVYLNCIECRRQSDIIIMGQQNGWGMGNLIKTGGRRGGDTILLSGQGCSWW